MVGFTYLHLIRGEHKKIQNSNLFLIFKMSMKHSERPEIVMAVPLIFQRV